MEMDIVVERAPGKSRRRIILNAPALKARSWKDWRAEASEGSPWGRRYTARIMGPGAGNGEWKMKALSRGIISEPLKGSARGLVMIRKTYALDGRALRHGRGRGTELEFKRLNPTKYVVRAARKGL